MQFTKPIDNVKSPGRIRRRILMRKKRKPDYNLPEKSCWHLYSLQTLQPEKFVKVVTKILKRDYLLIK